MLFECLDVRVGSLACSLEYCRVVFVTGIEAQIECFMHIPHYEMLAQNRFIVRRLEVHCNNAQRCYQHPKYNDCRFVKFW